MYLLLFKYLFWHKMLYSLGNMILCIYKRQFHISTFVNRWACAVLGIDTFWTLTLFVLLFKAENPLDGQSRVCVVQKQKARGADGYRAWEKGNVCSSTSSSLCHWESLIPFHFFSRAVCLWACTNTHLDTLLFKWRDAQQYAYLCGLCHIEFAWEPVLCPAFQITRSLHMRITSWDLCRHLSMTTKHVCTSHQNDSTLLVSLIKGFKPGIWSRCLGVAVNQTDSCVARTLIFVLSVII